MAAKKGLGRGFSSLIPDNLLDESFDPSAGDDHKVSDLRTLKLTHVTPDPDQPRKHFEEAGLAELTASIKEHGVLQPIVVIPLKDDTYQIVAGERRYRASKAGGKTTIPALVRTLSAQHKLELSLIENIQRRDLNPLETATAYAKLRDQFNLTLEDIGARVGGKSISAISNTLRLLKLPNEVKQLVAEGQLSEGQARPLIGANDATVKEAVKRIQSDNWSARKVEEYVSNAKPASQPHRGKVSSRPRPHQALTKRLAAPVSTQDASDGSGRIIIEFTDAEDRERLEKHLAS